MALSSNFYQNKAQSQSRSIFCFGQKLFFFCNNDWSSDFQVFFSPNQIGLSNKVGWDFPLAYVYVNYIRGLISNYSTFHIGLPIFLVYQGQKCLGFEDPLILLLKCGRPKQWQVENRERHFDIYLRKKMISKNENHRCLLIEKCIEVSFVTCPRQLISNEGGSKRLLQDFNPLYNDIIFAARMHKKT